jgi:hypothetical protein
MHYHGKLEAFSYKKKLRSTTPPDHGQNWEDAKMICSEAMLRKT